MASETLGRLLFGSGRQQPEVANQRARILGLSHRQVFLTFLKFASDLVGAPGGQSVGNAGWRSEGSRQFSHTILITDSALRLSRTRAVRAGATHHGSPELNARRPLPDLRGNPRDCTPNLTLGGEVVARSPVRARYQLGSPGSPIYQTLLWLRSVDFFGSIPHGTRKTHRVGMTCALSRVRIRAKASKAAAHLEERQLAPPANSHRAFRCLRQLTQHRDSAGAGFGDIETRTVLDLLFGGACLASAAVQRIARPTWSWMASDQGCRALRESFSASRPVRSSALHLRIPPSCSYGFRQKARSQVWLWSWSFSATDPPCRSYRPSK